MGPPPMMDGRGPYGGPPGPMGPGFRGFGPPPMGMGKAADGLWSVVPGLCAGEVSLGREKQPAAAYACMSAKKVSNNGPTDMPC